MNAARLQARFGKVVRENRKRVGLSQAALAERADLHPTYVTSVEAGRRNVSLRNIARIASALELSMADLLGQVEALSAERGDDAE